MSDKSEACPMCGLPVGMDLEEFNKQLEQQQQEQEIPVSDEQAVNTEVDAASTPSENNAPKASPTSVDVPMDTTVKKKRKTGLIIGIAIAVVVIGVLAFLFMMNKTERKDSEEEASVQSEVKEGIANENNNSDPIAMLNQLYNDYVLLVTPNPRTPDFSRVVDDFFTKKGKQKLLDAYDYDMECEFGDCYGIWTLRTMAQDGDGESKIIEILPVGNGKYTVKYLDMGFLGETMVTFVSENGKMKIDDFRNIFDESYEENVGYNTNNKLNGYEWLEGVWAGADDYGNFGRMIVTDSYYQVVNSNMDDASVRVENMAKRDYVLKNRHDYITGDGDGEIFGFDDYIGVDVANRAIYILQGEFSRIYLHKILANDFESAIFEANHKYPPQSPSVSDDFVNTKDRVVVIDGSQLRLRLGPSLDADTYKDSEGNNRHPNVGGKYKYLGKSGDFYKISFEGHELWVSKEYSHIDLPEPVNGYGGVDKGGEKRNYREISYISVTKNVWFVLDHIYSDGETISLTDATFGLYGAADDGRHQQLISGGQSDLLRIGQNGLIWTDYSKIYFNMVNMIVESFGHATSVSDGYILDHADIVFSPTFIKVNGNLVTSYQDKHLSLGTKMCLFANDSSGTDSVRDQTATLGTITITNSRGDVVARYIPVLDGDNRPCFYNTVSGAFIYHSGIGTPNYKL